VQIAGDATESTLLDGKSPYAARDRAHTDDELVDDFVARPRLLERDKHVVDVLERCERRFRRKRPPRRRR